MSNYYKNRDNPHPIDQLVSIAQEKLGIKKRNLVHEYIGVPACVASKVRNNKMQVSAEMILRLYDATGVSVDEIRNRLGVKKFEYEPLILGNTNAQPSGDQQTAQNEGTN